MKPSAASVSIESPRSRQSSLITNTRVASNVRAIDSVSSPVRLSATTDEFSLGQQLHPLTSTNVQQLLSQPSPFKHSHVISVKQYTRQDLHLLFTVAQKMRLGVQREGVLN